MNTLNLKFAQAPFRHWDQVWSQCWNWDVVVPNVALCLFGAPSSELGKKFITPRLSNLNHMMSRWDDNIPVPELACCPAFMLNPVLILSQFWHWTSITRTGKISPPCGPVSISGTQLWHHAFWDTSFWNAVKNYGVTLLLSLTILR